MARLTLHLGGRWVVPITTPRRFPAAWLTQFLVVTGLAGCGGHSPRRNDLRKRIDWNRFGVAVLKQGHAHEASR